MSTAKPSLAEVYETVSSRRNKWMAAARKVTKEFGVALKQQRMGRGLTQVEVARRAQVSPMFISDIEVGRRFAGPDVAERICKAVEGEA